MPHPSVRRSVSPCPLEVGSQLPPPFYADVGVALLFDYAVLVVRHSSIYYSQVQDVRPEWLPASLREAGVVEYSKAELNNFQRKPMRKLKPRRHRSESTSNILPGGRVKSDVKKNVAGSAAVRPIREDAALDKLEQEREDILRQRNIRKHTMLRFTEEMKKRHSVVHEVGDDEPAWYGSNGPPNPTAPRALYGDEALPAVFSLAISRSCSTLWNVADMRNSDDSSY